MCFPDLKWNTWTDKYSQGVVHQSVQYRRTFHSNCLLLTSVTLQGKTQQHLLSIYYNIYLIHCVQKNSTENECMNLFIQFIPSQKKKMTTKKNPEAHCQIYIKKKCRGWKVKKQKQTKKNLLQSHKRHKWLFSQKTHNIGDPQRDSSFPSLTLTTQTPPGFRRVQRWQAAALLTIA